MQRLLPCSLVAAVAAMTVAQSPAAAQSSSPFVGQTILVAFTFCPRGWAEADGSVQQIQSNAQLYALIGTAFGGNGTTTFNLPDLRGRLPVGVGQGQGLDNVVIGQQLGAPAVALTTDQMPAHAHIMVASSQGPATNDPTNAYLATFGGASKIYAQTPTLDLTLNPSVVVPTGSSQSFPLYQPSLTLRYCIAMDGVFPSRP